MRVKVPPTDNVHHWQKKNRSTCHLHLLIFKLSLRKRSINLCSMMASKYAYYIPDFCETRNTKSGNDFAAKFCHGNVSQSTVCKIAIFASNGVGHNS